MSKPKNSKPAADKKPGTKPKGKKPLTSVDAEAGTATIHGAGDAVPCAKDESPIPEE